MGEQKEWWPLSARERIADLETQVKALSDAYHEAEAEVERLREALERTAVEVVDITTPRATLEALDYLRGIARAALASLEGEGR